MGNGGDWVNKRNGLTAAIELEMTTEAITANAVRNNTHPKHKTRNWTENSLIATRDQKQSVSTIYSPQLHHIYIYFVYITPSFFLFGPNCFTIL